MGLPLANYHGRAEQKNPKLPFCVKLDRRQQACQISNEGFPVLRQIAHVQGDQCSLHLGTQQKYIYNHINSNVYYLIICICTYIYIYLCVCTNHALLVIIMSKKNPTNSSHISIRSKQNMLVLIEIVFELLHHVSQVSSKISAT